MYPEFVGCEVGRVQVRLCGVKHHAVNAGVGLVLVVLNIGSQCAGSWVGGEDGAVACVLVEGVAVDAIRRLLGGEEEDGASICCG